MNCTLRLRLYNNEQIDNTISEYDKLNIMRFSWHKCKNKHYFNKTIRYNIII